MIRVGKQLRKVGHLAAELSSGDRAPILAAVAGGWFLSLGVRMVYPAVLPQLRRAFDLDLTTAGFLITTLWAAYALGQLPGGILDDWFGGGRMLIASTGVSALALVLVATAPSVPVLFGATLAFGFATALYGVARFTILSATYPKNSGTAIGLTLAAGDLGNALLPPLASVIAVSLGWAFGFGFVIPLFVVATIGIHAVVPKRPRSSRTDGRPTTGAVATLSEIGVSLRNRSVLIVVGVQTLGYCIWQAFTAFYPTYLIEVKGMAPTTATTLFGAFFALGIAVKPAAGSAYDAYGTRASLPFVLVSITLAMVLLPLVDGLLPIVGVTVLASGLLGYGTITITYLTDAFPDDVRGTGLGFLRTCYMAIGATSPILVGILADSGYFDEAFFLLSGIGALTVMLSLLDYQ